MTRISIYSKDVNVTGNDRWIGSDAQNQNRTKNFTPDNVATYFNENQVIDLGVELRYFYDTLDPLQQRVFGSITFETEIGPQVNFSAISTFILSKYTMGHTDVSQFLDFLIGSNVILSRSNNINMFGYYKIDNIEPYLPDPNFFVVTLTFDAGNGYMKEDEDYFISLVQFEQAAPSTPTLQTVTDEGNVTTNSMIIENYNANYTNTLTSGSINVDYNDTFQHAYSEINVFEISANYTDPDNIFSFGKLSSDGYLELGIDNKVGTLNVGDLTNSITLKFPNKPLGSYTIATTEDITVPTLQTVTDEGNTTTNDVVVDSALYESVISNNYINVATKSSLTGVALTSNGVISFGNGSAYSYLSSDATNLNVNFKLPNKVSGTYTLATTADIPASLLVALPFTTDHLTATNNAYVIGDVVWYLGNVYRCIANNDSILPTAPLYWTNLGAGNPLVAQPLDWNSTSGNNQILNKPTIPTGTVTSVDLTMPSAFTVTGNPVTTSGTLAVTGAGVVSQYVRGDGSLANFPTSTGGGASLSFYLNGSVSQGTFGGVAFKEMDRTPILGAGTDFTIAANGYIQSFITDANVPNLLEIPAGNWNFETYFSASSGGGSPSFYVELYKWNGVTLSLIASNSATPEGITNGTAIDLYITALAVPQTTLLATDRLAVRIYVNNSGRTIKLHTEDNQLCEVITTFSTGITALNGLTAQVQSFATGTSGTDFAISSTTATHTFNLPTASAANRGALSSTDWNTFNNKFTLPALTSGSVLFSNGTTIAQDNANLFWDDTNKRLCLGTNTSVAGSALSISSAAQSNIQLIDTTNNASLNLGVGNFDATISSNGRVFLQSSTTLSVGTTNVGIGIASATLAKFHVVGNVLFSAGNVSLNSTSGNTQIGTTTDAGFKLDVNGTARVQGALTVSTGGASITGNLTVASSNLISGSRFQSSSGIFVFGNTFLYGAGGQNSSAVASGLSSVFLSDANWIQSSGTAEFASFRVTGTINQTGTATGITRGLHINPTLTSAADWRAIEVSSGITILGASTTAKASLRIPSGTAPTSPTNGDIWFDGTNLKIQVAGVSRTIVLL